MPRIAGRLAGCKRGQWGLFLGVGGWGDSMPRGDAKAKTAKEAAAAGVSPNEPGVRGSGCQASERTDNRSYVARTWATRARQSKRGASRVFSREKAGAEDAKRIRGPGFFRGGHSEKTRGRPRLPPRASPDGDVQHKTRSIGPFASDPRARARVRRRLLRRVSVRTLVKTSVQVEKLTLGGWVGKWRCPRWSSVKSENQLG